MITKPGGLRPLRSLQQRCRERGGRLGEKVAGMVVGVEESLDFPTQLGVPSTLALEEGFPLFVLQVEGGVEQCVRAPEPLRRIALRTTLLSPWCPETALRTASS